MTILYENHFETQSEVDTLYLPASYAELQGTHVWDIHNPIAGWGSWKMETNPDIKPWYYYLFAHAPYTASPVRISVVAALEVHVNTFGIGFQVVKNNLLTIMFTRLNFNNNSIEILESTGPHDWSSIAPIPYDIRRDNPIFPFRMWMEIHPGTLTYTKVGYHAFLRSSATNQWQYVISWGAKNSIGTDSGDALIVKINPQGSQGESVTAWVDDILVETI